MSAIWGHVDLNTNNEIFATDCVIDNREEVLKFLGAEDLKISDELLMKQAYNKWNKNLGRYVRGIYSFAHYNKNKLTLGVDPVAGRCLYYYIKKDKVVFSTLLKPILNLYPEIQINKNYITDFLYAPGMIPNIVAKETPYQDVYKVEPGTTVTIFAKEIVIEEYWSLDNPIHKYNKEKFMDLFTECVRDCTKNDINVGMALSSGLDSTAVAIQASKLLKERNGILHAFTYIPNIKNDKNDKNVISNEKQAVLNICGKYNNIENSFVDNKGKNAIDEIDKLLDILEIPIKAFVNIPNLIEIYEEALKRECKTVLIGQFGNSTISHGEINDVLFDMFYRKKYITFLKYFRHYCQHEKLDIKKALPRCIKEFKNIINRKKHIIFKYEITNPFLEKTNINIEEFIHRLKNNGWKTFEYFPEDGATYKENLKRKAAFAYLGEIETKLSHYTGVVIRDPSRDIRLLEYCYQMPYENFAINGTPRSLIRENFKDDIPYDILNNWNRYGFQNADWHLRVKRDWGKIKPILKSQFKDNIKVMTFLENIDSIDEAKLDTELSYVCFLMIADRFTYKIDI